jgi:hypothetical protein
VEQRKGYARGCEGLTGEPRDDDRVLASGEEKRRTLELRGHFSKHRDGLAFELREVAADSVLHRDNWTGRLRVNPRPGVAPGSS